MQEALNRTSDHLWAVVTNGRQLRLLRDSSALATAAYVEFDLEAIFDGELFNEFVLLYRLLHASRFQVAEGEPPATCWLEKWRTEAITSGTRALDQLRKGVQEAITILGTGFLKHPANAHLRENLDTKALHGALLRMVYRLLFLFVAEDRGALHPPGAEEQAKQRYAAYFSSTRLRAHARKRRGTAHTDQYWALKLVLDALGGNGQGNENGRPELAVPALGGLFTDTEADAPLAGLELSNDACWGRCDSWPRCVTPTPSGGVRWTTATWTPRSSVRSTSRCWSWCPNTAPPSGPSSWWSWRATTARPRARTTHPRH